MMVSCVYLLILTYLLTTESGEWRRVTLETLGLVDTAFVKYLFLLASLKAILKVLINIGLWISIMNIVVMRTDPIPGK